MASDPNAGGNSKPKGFFQVNQAYEEDGPSALIGLFFYSALMFTLPLLAYFFLKEVLDSEFQVEPPWNFLYPAIVAIAVVNIVIVLYIYKAFKEERKEAVSKTQPQTASKKTQ